MPIDPPHRREDHGSLDERAGALVGKFGGAGDAGAPRELLAHFATRVSSEFDHVLTRFGEHLQRIDDVAGDRAEVQDELADSRELLGRASSLLRQLAAFGDARRLTPQAIELRTSVGAWWPELQRLLGPKHPLELHLHGPGRVEIDVAAFTLALENLCLNAREASPPGSPIELRLRDEADGVTIELVDRGVGMDAQLQARALEPFFTTKPRHMGLGLSAAEAIVHAHGGWLTLDSEPGRGTSVTLWLPALASATEPEARRRVRALVIEPERLIARWMQRSLTSKGCEVRTAADVLAARELLRDGWPELIILDRSLPDGDAHNFALELARDRPGRPLVFASSRAQLRRDRDRGLAPLPAHVELLEKPYATRRFDAIVLRLIAELRARPSS